MHRTLNDIRRDGLEALRKRLGRAGVIRFLQQFDSGADDYAADRHAWVNAMPLVALKKLVALAGGFRPFCVRAG